MDDFVFFYTMMILSAFCGGIIVGVIGTLIYAACRSEN
jgi:hypothetical protein